MKVNSLLFLLFFSAMLHGQAPRLINYQGMARNSAGEPLVNRVIGLRFELRQGGPSGTSVFTEQQPGISTGPLGLFTTQIGKVNGTGLNQVNFQGGSLYLSVAVDTAGSGNFTELGSQQLVSVPYALHAESVPSSYTNNVLNIAGASYTLGQSPGYSAGTGISITGTVLSNAAPDQTVTLSAGNSNINISGTYPDFTVAASPSLNIAGNELSISNGNTVTLAPTLNILGNTLTIGPPGNSLTLPSPGTPTIVGSGIASVNPLTGTNFTVSVQQPSFNNAGPSSISGSYPSYTLNSPVIPTVSAAGIASVSPGPNYQVGVPQPSFSNVGPVTITGNYPNLTVTSPTVPASVNVSAAGIASVSAGPNYTVGVQAPNFSSTGPSSITGTYPNLILYSPVTPTVTSAGIATVSAGPIYQVGVPQPNFVSNGPVVIGGTYPNLTVTSPTVPPSTNVSAAGIATVSAGPNFTVGVPSPTFANAGPSFISGNYPNYTLNSPVTPTVSATGIASVSAGPNYLVGVPHPTFSSVGVTTISGLYPNLVVTTPVPPTPTVIGQGLAVVTPSTGINFTVNVPPLAYNATTGVLSSGTNTVAVAPVVSYTNNILNIGPATNSVDLSSSGAWKQSGTSVILSNTATTRVGIGTTAPGIGTGSAKYLSLSATDTYQSAAAAFEMQGASVATTVPFAKMDFFSVGTTSASNVARISAFRGGTTGEGMLSFATSDGTLTERMYINEFGRIGMGTSNPLENLQLQSPGTTQMSIISGSTSGAYLSFGTQANHFMGNILYDNNTNSMSFWTNNTADRLFINANGNVGIRNSNPSNDLSIYNPGPVASLQLRHSTSANGFITSFGTGNVTMLNHDNSPIIMGSNAVNKWFFMPDGELRIGFNSGTAYTGLSVRGGGAFNNRILITGGDNSNTYGGIISFAENQNQVGGMSIKLDAGGNRLFFTTDLAANNGIMSVGGYSGSNPGVAIGSSYAYGNPPVNGLIVEGNTGIGTLAPTERLDVVGSVKVVDGFQGDGKVFVSDAAGKGVWRALPTPTVYTSLNVSSTIIGTSPTALGIGVRTFNKAYANTQIEIDVYTRATTGLAVNPLLPFNNMKFEIYVDGVASSYSTEHVIFGQNSTEYITLKAVFSGLAVGSHTITIRANTDSSSSTGATVDPGGYGGKIIVQERF